MSYESEFKFLGKEMPSTLLDQLSEALHHQSGLDLHQPIIRIITDHYLRPFVERKVETYGLGHELSVDDAIQEAFLIMLRKPDIREGRGYLVAFAKVLKENVLIAKLRKVQSAKNGAGQLIYSIQDLVHADEEGEPLASPQNRKTSRETGAQRHREQLFKRMKAREATQWSEDDCTAFHQLLREEDRLAWDYLRHWCQIDEVAAEWCSKWVIQSILDPCHHGVGMRSQVDSGVEKAPPIEKTFRALLEDGRLNPNQSDTFEAFVRRARMEVRLTLVEDRIRDTRSSQPGPPVSLDLDPERELLSNEREQLVQGTYLRFREALVMLARDNQAAHDVFSAFYLEDKTLAAIGSERNLDPATVHYHKKKAIHFLREALGFTSSAHFEQCLQPWSAS